MGSSQISRRSFLTASAIGAAAVASPGLLAACATPSQDDTASASASSEAPKSGGILRVGMTGGGSTEALDPYYQFLAPDLARCFALYSYIGEIDGQYRASPLLAESVESADGSAKVWDIRLRAGLEFHNGKTVSSEDLIFSLNRMLDPEAQSAAGLLVPWVDLKGLKAMDERTVRVPLTQEVSVFKQALFNFLSTIVPVDFDPAKPVGAGPFKFGSFTAGDRSVFTRFENYFGGPAYADQLDIISFKDDAALVNALLAGDIDVAGGLSAANANVVEAGGLPVISTPSMGWQPLTMKMDAEPFTDPRVREAFRLIPDRNVMLNQAFSGRGSVRKDLYGWNSGGYPADLADRAQDLEKAKSLLKEAGLENLTIDLATTPAFPGQVEICEVFAEQAKGAGVTVNVVKTTPDIYYSEYYLQAPFASDTFVNVPYLNNTLQCQLPTSPYNGSAWSDAEFTALYEKALATVDEAARDEVVAQMQKIQYDRGALLIGTSFDGLDATGTQVRGLNSGELWAYSLNGYHLERVWFA